MSGPDTAAAGLRWPRVCAVLSGDGWVHSPGRHGRQAKQPQEAETRHRPRGSGHLQLLICPRQTASSKTKFTAIPFSKRNLFTGRRFDPVWREQGQLRGGARRDVHRHQADHAHRAHPPLHALHHGHRHPLRLLLRHQAAPGRLGARGAV